MADSKADKVQVAGSDVAENYDAINFTKGITATESNGVVTVTSATRYLAYAGKLTMGGGNAAEAETVTGLAATDVVIATITDNSTNDNVILLEAKPSTNTLTLLFNEDPGAGVVVDYVAYRAV